MNDDQLQRLVKLGEAFTPGSPVNNQDLFAGRLDQLSQIFSAVTQRGYHAVLFGERGVGKTSLANFVSRVFANDPARVIARVTCDAGDNFSSIWKKAFKEIKFATTRPAMGFSDNAETLVASLADYLPDVANPDDVRRVLASLAVDKTVLVVLDEYDRILDKMSSTLISDTIKVLSDTGTNATIVVIGVADSVEELIDGHHSIERALVQIPMPRMSKDEIGQIIDKGGSLLGMTIDRSARQKIVDMSQGVPYVTHLLSLNCFRAAVMAASDVVGAEHVELGIKASLDQWNESIKRTYYQATKSHQPGNIYKEVLLACAISDDDELGFFTASAVRNPLREITKRDYDIPNFAAHLKQFSEDQRGNVLTREGQQRRWRYRFTSPMMRPYIIMRGHTDGLWRLNK
ncbi:AAA family ATPase [Luteibacter sp. CQ10]|uniref:AAA family ATPase n=1 Tax=Luteibacter sp. CQ10 TaxID=2805821 RepID=UPI0034A2D854